MPDFNPATKLLDAIQASKFPQIRTLDVALKLGAGSYKTKSAPDRRDSVTLRDHFTRNYSDWESFDDALSMLPSLRGEDVEPLPVDILFTVDVLLPPGDTEATETLFDQEATIWNSWQTENLETCLPKTVASPHVRFLYKQHISYF